VRAAGQVRTCCDILLEPTWKVESAWNLCLWMDLEAIVPQRSVTLLEHQEYLLQGFSCSS
jgi:hypothetical protein